METAEDCSFSDSRTRILSCLGDNLACPPGRSVFGHQTCNIYYFWRSKSGRQNIALQCQDCRERRPSCCNKEEKKLDNSNETSCLVTLDDPTWSFSGTIHPLVDEGSEDPVSNNEILGRNKSYRFSPRLLQHRGYQEFPEILWKSTVEIPDQPGRHWKPSSTDRPWRRRSFRWSKRRRRSDYLESPASPLISAGETQTAASQPGPGPSTGRPANISDDSPVLTVPLSPLPGTGTSGHPWRWR